MRISDWISDVCSSDLQLGQRRRDVEGRQRPRRAPDLLGALQHLADQVLEKLLLEGQRALGRRGDLLLERRQLDGREAHRRGQCLTVDEGAAGTRRDLVGMRSEEHTSELQSLMRISYA